MPTNWVSGGNNALGNTQPGVVDEGVARGGTTYPSVTIGTISDFYDTGTTRLGSGKFIFLPGVTATVAGDMVTYYTSAGTDVGGDVNDGAATQRWAGTANTGAPLAVATAAANTQAKWSWYQIQGGAVVNITGTVVVGAAAYFSAVGVVSTTAVAGKQIVGMRSSSVHAVPAAGQAVFTINNPVVQSAIT